MGRIETVLGVLQNAIVTAINSYVPAITQAAQVYIGWPTPTELTEILNQGGYAVTIFPLTGGKTLPAKQFHRVFTNFVPPSLIATVVQNTLTLTGTVTAGLNIHTLFGHPKLGLKDAYCQTNSSDTPSTVLSSIAAAINTYPAPVTASISNGSVNVSGATSLKCNIGTIGTTSQEVQRWLQRVQVSIWTPSGMGATVATGLRSAVADAINSQVGVYNSQMYDLGDNTSAYISSGGPPVYRDDSVSDYNAYEAHIIFNCEYGVMQVSTAVQVGVIEEVISVQSLAPVTVLGG